MMPVRHYYHVYAAGAWQVPVQEHIAAMGEAELCNTDMTVSLVGLEDRRQAAGNGITSMLRRQGLPAPVAWREADEGWEQVTLQAIHDDVREIPGEFAVLYAHTKGAHEASHRNAQWRRMMTGHLVSEWQLCMALLDDGYDAVGCHWIIQYPQNPPFFAGNFWWARASYLRTLPPPENDNRWSAELWLSLYAPKVFDLQPGFPDYPL